MAITMQQDFAKDAIMAAARDMANAARTAPKTRGVDRLHIALVDGDTLEALASHMKAMHESGQGAAHFVRDADNLRLAGVCLIVGTEITPMPGGCQTCGMRVCVNKQGYVGAACMYAVHDLGLAIGSAAAMAADRRIDNRVMFSIGEAAVDLGLFPEKVGVAIGIPLSATGKSPFYDRKPL